MTEVEGRPSVVPIFAAASALVIAAAITLGAGLVSGHASRLFPVALVTSLGGLLLLGLGVVRGSGARPS